MSDVHSSKIDPSTEHDPNALVHVTAAGTVSAVAPTVSGTQPIVAPLIGDPACVPAASDVTKPVRT